jgi:hypothetical protein
VKVKNELEIEKYAIFATHKQPDRHNAPNKLKYLLSHPKAKEYIQKFSQLSKSSVESISKKDIYGLIYSIREYNILYEEWIGSGRYSDKSLKCLEKFKDIFSEKDFAINPVGAGFADSFLLISNNTELSIEMAKFIDNDSWCVRYLKPSSGLNIEVFDNYIEATVPLRVDLIGAADLGEDPMVNAAGACLSVAVEPKNVARWVFEK